MRLSVANIRLAEICRENEISANEYLYIWESGVHPMPVFSLSITPKRKGGDP